MFHTHLQNKVCAKLILQWVKIKIIDMGDTLYEYKILRVFATTSMNVPTKRLGIGWRMKNNVIL